MILVLGFTLRIYKRALLESIAPIVADSNPFVLFNPIYVLYTLLITLLRLGYH